MNGYLLIDKPKGWTSFDVVNKVRHIVQNSQLNNSDKKRFPVGHTGTLDPLATGLLVLLLGKYTKRAPELTKLDKTYQVTVKLGETSSTGDGEGVKTIINSRRPRLNDIKNTLKLFTGEIDQVPPVFSAIKIDGQRAYKLARAGKKVEIEPRKVTIYTVGLKSYDYPYLDFTTEVSSGTYVRSLVEDIGKVLETGAYMCDLKRTKIGSFDIKSAIDLKNISAEKILKNLRTLA